MFHFVSITYTLFLFLLPIALAVILATKQRATAKDWMVSTILASGGCYLLLLASVQAIERHYEQELARYDLNHDGGFSLEEQSPAMEKAMADLTHDTGRTLAPFTGLMTCPIYAAFWHLLFGVPSLLWAHRERFAQSQKARA